MSCSPSVTSDNMSNNGTKSSAVKSLCRAGKQNSGAAVLFESKLPELLAPAGSPAALAAAIEAGADAVYFGGARHNARRGAVNFTEEDIVSSVSLAHAYGVKMYMTLNTLAYDRELPELLEDARSAYAAGVDALIVADLGVAAEIHRILPDFELHASTQASGHSAEAGKILAEMGFSRMVCAREMSLSDIKSYIATSPIESEVFVHGALCVCHSGQCLFSSMVGGRSGNRGECAQPCRLPYRSRGGNSYPLSLKDLCLAKYVPELIEAGVSSLKIEGRMKSPEYVYAVTSVWRRLLDERRAATDSEMRYLASIFSRGGFTDGYFTQNIGSHMLGVRSEEDKSASRTLPPFEGITKKIPLSLSATIKRGVPMSLTATVGTVSRTVTGDIPEAALRTPADVESVGRSLSKLGGTPYSLSSLDIDLDGGLAIPVSKLNDLRRRAISAHSEQGRALPTASNAPKLTPKGQKPSYRSATFWNYKSVTAEARDYFDIIFLPLSAPESAFREGDGVVIPPVVFDSERSAAADKLKILAALGVRDVLLSNIGHISLAREAGMKIHGDIGLNVTNSTSVALLESAGAEDVILSPELSLPRARDIRGATRLTVYGRLPLMVLEKCLASEISDCKKCSDGKAELVDRRGARFPVLRIPEHRNIVFNSLPTNMSDRAEELDRNAVMSRHFVFTVETPADVNRVIDAYRRRAPLGGEVRRI